ncbi:sialidase family protein [Paenibacillus sp. HJGM_3]|uniref:sialidase family protein n=1 Tax=Paenibacillus sp. HJGM_3 TaxID=3379816 RepID=UPI00385CDFE2
MLALALLLRSEILFFYSRFVKGSVFMMVNVRQLLTINHLEVLDMKGKMMDSAKKKAGVVLLFGALIAALGVGTAYAANFHPSLQVKMENGVRLYSTDGGKTWSKNAPNGVTVSDNDGKLTITNGTPPKDGEGKGTLTKVENGVRSYSTDGGKTWSETAPDGAEESITTGEGGKTIHTLGNPSGAVNGTALQVKIENGVRLYSTDGGNTWSETAPSGVTVSDEDGKLTILNGTPPKNGEAEGTFVKVENGVRSYSTDGGKTWSETVPDGAENSLNGDRTE